MEFRDTLNLELSDNPKLAFELALNKLGATEVTKEYTKIKY